MVQVQCTVEGRINSWSPNLARVVSFGIDEKEKSGSVDRSTENRLLLPGVEKYWKVALTNENLHGATQVSPE